ncbi:MAG: HAMP domain-containing protein [Cellulosilyticum sp.]|nr:HAMP domain-containing protein [Cellulosilyticum sp.]
MRHLFKNIYGFFTFIIKFFLALLNGIFILIYNIFNFFIRRFKFSMGFKINFVYSLLYIILFYLTYMGSYNTLMFYLETHPDSLEVALLDYINILPAILIISFGFFSFLGNHLVHKLLKPIKDMTDRVKDINGTSLNRLDTNVAKDELKDLAITFNEMLDRLELYMNQQKQFVSDASHELRTPIAIIQGYTEMLERWGKDDPAILEESINSLSQETANMKQLLEKLLFLSRSDKKTLKVDKEIFNLSQLCYEVIKETGFIDDEHDILSKITDDVMLSGDKGMIKELIRILMDNALKYTPEGGTITLGCNRSKQNVILSIQDTGIGIAREHIPHLFERFYRIDEARNKSTGGTGLGLAIAHQIIKAHDAQISVTSEVNQGTSFLIFFN